MKVTLRHGLGLLLGASIIYLGSGNVRRVGESLSPPFVYWKDCIQPYLMGKAILQGANPYTPLPQLARAWLPKASPANHPTPYPPLVGLLGVPLALLSFESVVRVWLAVELGCLLAALILLCRFSGVGVNPITLAVLYGLALVWRPVSDELRQGQFTSGLLLLLTASWLALRQNKDGLGGVLLGALISIKLIAWPVVLWLMLCRRWRAVRAAAACVVVAHLLALSTIGISGIVDYYVRVGPMNAALWRPSEGNYSAWAWGNRLFQGAGFSFVIQPWWKAPGLALVATYLFPTLLLCVGLWLARRAAGFDTAFSILIGVSILVSPVAWSFYLILTAIPIAVLASRLSIRGWPVETTVLAALALALLSIPADTYEHMARSFGERPEPTSMLVVPFGPSLLLLTPVIGMFGLLWLTWRLDAVTEP